MSQLKVDTITDEAGTGSPSLPNGLTVGGVNYPSTGPLSNRNKIINGAMVIDQRNAGAAVTPADGAFCTDRFSAGLTQASKFSFQQVADAPVGFVNSIKVTSLSAYSVLTGDLFEVRQFIEGNNISDLGWGTANAKAVTLSFWAKSSLTGTFGGAVGNDSGRSYPFTYTIAAADTWEYKTVTIAGDTTGTWLTTTGVGIRVRFSLGAGASFSGTAGAWAALTLTSATGATSVVATNGATLNITGVQLEAGDTATPFEHRSFGQELALCERYFQTYTNPPLRGVASGAAAADRCAFILPTTMRATPTAALSGTLSIFDGNGVDTTTGIAVSYARADKMEFDFVTTGALTAFRPACVFEGGVGGSISLSAEL